MQLQGGLHHFSETGDSWGSGLKTETLLTGTKMQEVDQDPYICPDLGDLPDLEDLFLDDNDDFLGKLVDNVLLGDPWLNCEDGIEGFDEFSTLTELLNSDIQPLRQEDTPTGKTTTKRKRSKVPHSKQSADENTPTRAKRKRGADRGKHIEVQTEPAVTQGSDASDLSPVEFFSTPPPNIVPLSQVPFITIQDLSPGYQVVRTLRLSPSVFRLPLPSTAAPPQIIFVPAPSPASKCQVPPLSPVGGAVAPVQMSSSPPGSLSDTASRAMSPPSCVSPQSPISDKSPFKESPVPQSPTYLDIPQTVKDYIQDTKAHMSQTCEDMEAGLSLTSHYVDVQVTQREIPRTGKNTNKCLEKELVIMGDTDRKKNMVGMNQIFESSDGNKPKRYILLLGSAGMGKTTRIRRLCLDWSKDCIPQFDFVFLLDGKALTLTKPVHSLQTLLLSLSSLAPSCTDPEAVFAQILAAPKRVLIIFDGFEELREYEILLQAQEKDLIASLQKDSKAQSYTVRQVYSAILQRVLLPGCTLLVSTRPRGNVGPLLRRADSLLDVCGFSPSDVETYLSKYFTDPDLRVSAMNCLKSSSYLNLLCWNPGLCRLVCLVLEQSQNSEVLPRTLTGLCHQVLHLKMEAERRRKDSKTETETETQRSEQSEEETQTQISTGTQLKKRQSRKTVCTRSRARGTGRGNKNKDNGQVEVEVEEVQICGGGDVDRTEKVLLSQLSSLAWEGVKANSSVVSREQTVSTKLKEFGLRTGLLLRNPLTPSEKGEEKGNKTKVQKKTKDDKDCTTEPDDHILLWASPFLQSFLAGVHVSLSRMVADRTFQQTLPFNTGARGRRRPQREGLELTQRFAVGLLFHDRTELQRLHHNTNTAFRDMLVTKQNQVTKHLEGLSLGDLSPAQILEACHYVYEGCFTHSEGGGDSRLAVHLAANLPELLTFRGVPLSPPDVFTVRNILQRGGGEGRCFSLDLRESGIQISGLRSLMELSNINTYRACIADAITLWEQLEQSVEEELLHGAVSKFKIHPLKATQVSHIEHLAKLVDIHTHRRLSDSPSQSDSVLADGVPAVKELQKLEFEFGPENGPLALPKLWELLPGLHNLQHLDLENSKIGDDGAEKLADALVPLCSLEILNLSQNCIGDRGVKKLADTLMHLPKLHRLSLYRNVISDEGAESLAAALPHMASLADLDVAYNKLTDVGAQSLGTSLGHCKQIRSLRMWNECIPVGVLERLQQRDQRILWH
ncbi:MHC class II transactivator isoform X2 [Sphaeramia orbicularis]|uniref:NACHT domain-containing protein n=1 Tax=Sphaeramia orbicularis TaxID=375764 RepID=A0A672YD53_9TELE|nr:MHC class II transactivator isoform X2 [Sphaeramia orbicularis]